MRPAVLAPLLAAAATLVLAACSGSHPGAAPSTPTSQPDSAGAPAFPDWPTYHGDLGRSGYAASMPPVSGALQVSAKVALDGAVYASPIVAGGDTILATENNSVYALGPTNTTLWHRRLGAPSPAGERPCGNIDPLGITGTPVYSAQTGDVYVVAELSVSHHELFALAASTGAIRWHTSVDLPGVDAKAMQERGALTIAGGRVWVPFGGLAGDCGAYKGRLIGVNLDGSGSTVSYTVPTKREAGIWTPPGPVVYGLDLFVAVGNGESGVGDSYDFSDSVLKVDLAGRLADSFSPASWPSDNDSDLDLGSQAPAIVAGTWVYADGKSGAAYVLALDHLGGIGGQVSQATVCRSFGGTAVVGSTVYVPCSDSGDAAVRISSGGKLSVLWRAAGSIHGSPVIGGGRVWALDQQGGVLFALDPATGKIREQIDVGATSRFATPALSGNRVLVGTLTGLTVVTTS